MHHTMPYACCATAMCVGLWAAEKCTYGRRTCFLVAWALQCSNGNTGPGALDAGARGLHTRKLLSPNLLPYELRPTGAGHTAPLALPHRACYSGLRVACTCQVLNTTRIPAHQHGRAGQCRVQ